jgi:hypothetical protein
MIASKFPYPMVNQAFLLHMNISSFVASQGGENS